MDTEQGYVKALIVMLFFWFFTLAAEGSTVSIIPYVQEKNLGIVSAIIVSGGYLFATVSQAVFYQSISDSLLPFRLHSLFVFLSAFLTFFINFELHGSLLVKPKLACYCDGGFFAYALEWELWLDSRYRVISTYLSPKYKGMLFKQGKKETYVKAAKVSTVE